MVVGKLQVCGYYGLVYCLRRGFQVMVYWSWCSSPKCPPLACDCHGYRVVVVWVCVCVDYLGLVMWGGQNVGETSVAGLCVGREQIDGDTCFQRTHTQRCYGGAGRGKYPEVYCFRGGVQNHRLGHIVAPNVGLTNKERREV